MTLLRVYSAFVRRLSGHASAGRNREGPSTKGASRFDPFLSRRQLDKFSRTPFLGLRPVIKWNGRISPIQTLTIWLKRPFSWRRCRVPPSFPGASFFFSGGYRRVSVPIRLNPREDRMTQFRITGIGLRGVLREFSRILACRVGAGSHGTRTPQKPRLESCFPLRLLAGYKPSPDVVRIQVIVFSMEAIPLFFQGRARERFRPLSTQGSWTDEDGSGRGACSGRE